MWAWPKVRWVHDMEMKISNMKLVFFCQHEEHSPWKSSFLSPSSLLRREGGRLGGRMSCVGVSTAKSEVSAWCKNKKHEYRIFSTKPLKLTVKITVPIAIVTTEARRGSVGQEEVREAVRSSCKYDVMGGSARTRWVMWFVYIFFNIWSLTLILRRFVLRIPAPATVKFQVYCWLGRRVTSDGNPMVRSIVMSRDCVVSWWIFFLVCVLRAWWLTWCLL